MPNIVILEILTLMTIFTMFVFILKFKLKVITNECTNDLILSLAGYQDDILMDSNNFISTNYQDFLYFKRNDDIFNPYFTIFDNLKCFHTTDNLFYYIFPITNLKISSIFHKKTSGILNLHFYYFDLFIKKEETNQKQRIKFTNLHNSFLDYTKNLRPVIYPQFMQLFQSQVLFLESIIERDALFVIELNKEAESFLQVDIANKILDLKIHVSRLTEYTTKRIKWIFEKSSTELNAFIEYQDSFLFNVRSYLNSLLFFYGISDIKNYYKLQDTSSISFLYMDNFANEFFNAKNEILINFEENIKRVKYFICPENGYFNLHLMNNGAVAIDDLKLLYDNVESCDVLDFKYEVEKHPILQKCRDSENYSIYNKGSIKIL